MKVKCLDFLTPRLVTHKMRMESQQYRIGCLWKVERVLFSTQQLYDSLRLYVRSHHVPFTLSSCLATSPGFRASQALQESSPSYTPWLSSASPFKDSEHRHSTGPWLRLLFLKTLFWSGQLQVAPDITPQRPTLILKLQLRPSSPTTQTHWTLIYPLQNSFPS